MTTETFNIKVAGSMPYARLNTYMWDESEEMPKVKRPLIFMCPGGGYEMTSDREADPIALQFMAMGYNVAILRYSVAPAEYPVALNEAFYALKLIYKKSEEWNVDINNIYVQGCSAGGHLAASIGMFWHEDKELIKPAGMILCYPVITSGEFAHRGSFEALLKSCYTPEMLKRNSLELQVTENTPKAFIWHTYTDDCVPVENSLLLIQSMKKYDIPVEFHMYPQGGHGLSTCDELSMCPNGYGVQKECSSWLGLVKTWLDAGNDQVWQESVLEKRL
nr:alpha/beta hydrolase [uncultured Agathobacter sp.]